MVGNVNWLMERAQSGERVIKNSPSVFSCVCGLSTMRDENAFLGANNLPKNAKTYYF